MREYLYFVLFYFFSLTLAIHAGVSIWQMLYSWLEPEKTTNPSLKRRVIRKTFFSIIIPCRHEKGVIAVTLRHLLKQNYNKGFFEVLIPIAKDDYETIEEATKIADKYPKQVKVITFSDGPINKPHGINVAFKKAKGDYVAIFDAEDDINVNILAFVNDIIEREGRKIIQTSVELVNWNSNWFTLEAALEYFFWFNSRLHWFARRKIVPFGGVGIFLPREIPEKVGGWDENCLTEDAKLGIDCSIRKFPIFIASSESFATKEEVPSKLSSFLKQRSRWIQGFIQIFLQRKWTRLKFMQKLFLFSIIFFPFFQIVLFLWSVISVIWFGHLQLFMAMVSILPLALLVLQVTIQLCGIVYMLKQKNQIRLVPLAILQFIVGYFPYQVLITVAAFRALIRQFMGNSFWEKTAHENSHRKTVGINSVEYS